MNPDDLYDMEDYKIVIGSTTLPVTGSTTASSITVSANGPANITQSKVSYSFLDAYMMNNFTIDHKVSEVEMLKLKEVKPDFADDIKENIAKNLARDIAKKISYTKKKLVDDDTHHFIGRIWCFTTDELKQLIEDARNA